MPLHCLPGISSRHILLDHALVNAVDYTLPILGAIFGRIKTP